MLLVCVDTIEDGVDDRMDGVVNAGRIRCTGWRKNGHRRSGRIRARIMAARVSSMILVTERDREIEGHVRAERHKRRLEWNRRKISESGIKTDQGPSGSLLLLRAKTWLGLGGDLTRLSPCHG